MATPFRVKVYNAAGVAQGELLTVYELEDTRSLDKIGTVSFMLAGNDPHIAYITPGCQFDIFDEVDGYIGRYIYRTADLNERQDVPDLRVRADEVLVEMRRTLVGFKRNYYFTPVDQVIQDLVELTSGWTTECDLGIGNTSVTYEGESVFAAVDELRDRWGMHFRRKTSNEFQPRVLQFGAFGTDSGLVLSNLEGQIQPAYAMFRYLAQIKTLRQTTDADEIVNRVIALGAGQGAAQLTLEAATGGLYPLLSAANQDGSLYYYVENAASIALYGLRPKVVSFSNIRPIDNNETDIARAKTALKYAAENYLGKHLAPKVEYELTVQGLLQNLDVGDTLRLRFNGSTNGVNWLTVDENFYLMDLTRKRTAKGERTARMTIASVNTRRTTDTDVIVDVVRDITSLKMHLQPQVWWSENTYVKFISGLTVGYIPGAPENAYFKLEFDTSVTAIHKVRIRFKTSATYASSSNEVNFVSNSNAIFAGPLFNDHYPSDIRFYIDGTDFTDAHGGPWNPGGVDAPLDVAFDITDDLIGLGNIRSDHVLEFRSLGRLGDPAFPTFRPYVGPNNPANISTGVIELNIRVQGTAQAVITS